MMSDFITINTITVPELFGPLRGANGNARITGPCGDTMEFWIRVENDIITAAHYTTDGCYYSNKCGTTTAIMATEVPLSVAGQFTQSDILAVAGDIEQASEHCALLAANTLKAAIADYRRQQYRATRSGDKAEAPARSVLNPKPPLLVSCRGTEGRDNALVVVYGGNCSFDPPSVMVGIVPSRYSYHIVKETGCFVVNITPTEMKDAYDYLGSHSGRDEDKLKKLGVRTRDGIKVNAPVLIDCPINIECTVTGSVLTGSHEMFIGKIEYVHADREILDEKGAIDWSMVRFL